MGKLFLFGCILLAGAGFVSCEKDGAQKPANPAVPEIEGAVPYEPFVSYEEACKLAQIAIDMLEADQSTRSAGRSINESRVVRYTVKATRSEDPDDTLLYVFNFDGGGYAVVATDRRVNPLLAVVDEGSYSPVRKTPRNVLSGFDLYMNASLDLLEGLRAIPYGSDLPSEPGRMQIRHIPLEETNVKPMIPVKWGTEFPYNGYCPMVSGVQATAGYAATAVAQIMTAYTYPKTMQLTYSGADVESVTLNWPGILQHVRTLGDKFDCPEHRAIAQMCREIGEQLNTKYNIKSTADFAAIPGCLHHFGFAADPVSDYSHEAIRQSYNKRGMVCMRGTAVDGMKTHDHVWVVDGMRHNVIKTEIWFIPDGSGPNRLLESNIKSERFTHCNWGFEGDNNGYFSIGVFDMKGIIDDKDLDKGSELIRSLNFTQSLKIITGIKPQQ